MKMTSRRLIQIHRLFAATSDFDTVDPDRADTPWADSGKDRLAPPAAGNPYTCLAGQVPLQ